MEIMELVDLEVKLLKEAPWNVNRIDESMLQRLRSSIAKYGFLQNLVVRPHGGGYEVLSGNQRLKLLNEFNLKKVPCAIVKVNDGHARLVAQALNRIHGEDDLGLRAELLREVLEVIPEEEVLAILPETLDSLKGMASLGQETMVGYVRNWERARSGRLRNLQFKLTDEQLETVERALEKVLPEARKQRGVCPNTRGIALYLICKHLLKKEDQDDS